MATQIFFKSVVKIVIENLSSAVMMIDRSHCYGCDGIQYLQICFYLCVETIRCLLSKSRSLKLDESLHQKQCICKLGDW